MESNRNTASFRDPSGYVYSEGNAIRRVINPIYFPQYHAINKAGLYKILFSKKHLIPHKEISVSDEKIVLESATVPFVTYPYEWSFFQYKHAALLTLKIQQICLEHQFTLKDASAFNITFHEGRPIFIDTLSFDFYHENTPWNAYSQFIRHFLGPLVLSHYFGSDFLKTLATDIDGIPLSRLSKMLPAKTYLSPTLLANIHMLAKYDSKYAATHIPKKSKLSKSAQLRLIRSLYDYINELSINETTEWDHYYNQINYNESAYQHKKKFTAEWFAAIGGKSLIDIGGNDGTFARELNNAELVIVADVDANAVGQNYRKILKNKEKNMFPIVADVLNPASGYGFNNQERLSLLDRVKVLNLSGCLALAVIHHLTLSGNIPFSYSARFFASLAPELLIEFPTRNDSWVQFLLKSKREFAGHFDFYNEAEFEKAYGNYFEIITKHPIEGSDRILYRMKLKSTVS